MTASQGRFHPPEGTKRSMSANDQRAVHPGRTRAVSLAVVRRSQRLRLILEYLRSHDRLADPASASGNRQDPDLREDRRAQS
jgi:hypothetical protein